MLSYSSHGDRAMKNAEAVVAAVGFVSAVRNSSHWLTSRSHAAQDFATDPTLQGCTLAA